MHWNRSIAIPGHIGRGVAFSRTFRRPAGRSRRRGPGHALHSLVALVKRAFYLRLSPIYAIAGALLYAVVVPGGLFLAHAFGLASPLVAFLLMGIGAALTSALLLFRLRTRLEGTTIDLQSWDILKKHWSYGRWALAGAAAMWLPYNIYYFFGVAQAGELKALMNFYAPVLQSCGALSLLLLPYAARAHHQGKAGSSLAWKISLLCVSGTIVYWAVVMVFREPPSASFTPADTWR